MNRNTLYLIYDYMIFYDFDPAPPIPSLEEHSAVFFFLIMVQAARTCRRQRNLLKNEDQCILWTSVLLFTLF